MPDQAERKQARTLALRYLSYRDRSQHEVASHLSGKGVSSSTIRETIDYLKNLNYINDARFALAWARSRAERKNYGKLRLRRELTSKGIEPEITEITLATLFGEINEREIAESCARKKLVSLEGLEPEKKRRRMAQFLHRKGFPTDLVFEIVNRFLPRNTGCDPD